MGGLGSYSNYRLQITDTDSKLQAPEHFPILQDTDHRFRFVLRLRLRRAPRVDCTSGLKDPVGVTTMAEEDAGHEDETASSVISYI